MGSFAARNICGCSSWDFSFAITAINVVFRRVLGAGWTCMIRRRLERPRIARDARPRRNDLQGTKVPDTDGKIFILAEIFRFKATRIPVKAPRLQWALRRQADCEVEWVGARERDANTI